MSSNTPYISNTTGPRWPLWAMTTLAVVSGILMWRSCDFYPETRSEGTAPAPMIEAPAAATTTEPANYSKKLSTGFDLSGLANGMEGQLVGFIESDKPVDKETWFNFDRLTFRTGSAELDMDKSKEQLANIHEVLKAFPKVNLKVGGYTDNTGSEEANMKLSQERATTVMNALVGLGTQKSRLEAEGYGSQHPVCAANDTEECKAQNRRIAVRVTAK